MIYLKLPINAHQANLMGNYHCAGFPSMTAFDGMIHSLERSMGEIGIDLRIDKWSIIAESVEMKKGHKRFAIGNRSIDGSSEINASIVDEKNGDISVTLILAINSSLNIADLNSKRESSEFSSCFKRLRLAGGVTTIYTSPYSETFDGRCIKFFSTYKDALKTINRQAFLVEDHSHKIDNYTIGNESKIQTLIRLMRRINPDHKKGNSELINNLQKDNPDGFYTPVAVGYYAISDAEIKEGTRDITVPHAYAEPIVGIARLRKVGSVLFNLNNKESEENILPFWVNTQICDDDKYYEQKNLYAIIGTK